jgi:hypothetical protein
MIYLKSKGADAYIENEVLSFSFPFNSNNLKAFGYKAFEFPAYLRDSGIIKGYLQFKENQFKATVSNIVFIDFTNAETNLNQYAVKKNTIKKNQTKALDLLDNFIYNLFKNSKKSEW